NARRFGQYAPAVFYFACQRPFLLPSRWATALNAICRLRSGESFWALALPPLLAIWLSSACERFFARALPPKRPSACAFGFFFRPIGPAIILLISKQIKMVSNHSCLFFASQFSSWREPHSKRT